MIKVYLNKLQWSWLAAEVKTIVETAPVKDMELESLCIADMYRKRIHSLTFYKPGKDGMVISLTQVEAYAINNYFAGYNDSYDIFLRPMIEPKLLAGK